MSIGKILQTYPSFHGVFYAWDLYSSWKSLKELGWFHKLQHIRTLYAFKVQPTHPLQQNIPLKTNPWNPPHKTQSEKRIPWTLSLLNIHHPPFPIMPFKTSAISGSTISITKPFYKKQWGFMKTMKHRVPENNETAEIITRLHKSNESTEKNNEAIERQ